MRNPRLNTMLTAIFLLTLAPFAHAAVNLPQIFSDNMVLQRDIDVPIWGKATPEETVTVKFAGQEKGAKADAKGKWRIKLDPMKANGKPQQMTITSDKQAKPIIISNVLVGDVWLCSGQSNMEWSVHGTLNSAAEAAKANLPQIRHIKITKTPEAFPVDDATGRWAVCSPKTVGGFTAVGFYFARELYQQVGVPIGLINSSWGGTKIEPWICPKGYQSEPELARISKQLAAWDLNTDQGKSNIKKYIQEVKGWTEKADQAVADGTTLPSMPVINGPVRSHQSPTALYNGMIHPIQTFAIRGALWYQGESNGNEGVSYYHKMKALIEGWRQVWQQGDFPFYFVQLANFQGDSQNPAGGDGWAKLREAQRQSLSIPNTGMATIIDIGDAKNIHPKDKQDVGKRLAQWALKDVYGKPVVASGPLYKNHKIEGNKVIISFDNVGSGLMVGKKEGLAPTQEVPGGELKRFAIAGKDGKWYWADAVIEGDTVVVSHADVTDPVAVSYAYSMNPVGANLYNKEGLPASPFRTADKKK